MLWKFPTYEIDQPINWELLENTFSWFADMRNVPQHPEWHGEGDVFIHTKMVVDELLALTEYQELNKQDRHILFAAAMLHDVEKRSTTITEVVDGQTITTSPKHALKGEFTARSILYTDIQTPFNIREQICKLVRLHGLPLWVLNKDEPRKSVIEASTQVDTKLLYILAKADMKGRICADKDEELLKVELFKELCLEYNCFGTQYNFASNYGRFLFLTRDEIAPNYLPYEDLKFEVTMMCALPGTGKDRYINNHIQLPVLSLDDIRRKHKIDPGKRKENGRVIQLAKEQAKVWMRSQQSFVFNATNITRDMRSKWISLFLEYKAKVKIIYLEVPHKVLLKQNKDRMYTVPESVIEKLIGRLEIPNFREAHEVEYIVD